MDYHIKIAFFQQLLASNPDVAKGNPYCLETEWYSSLLAADLAEKVLQGTGQPVRSPADT